MNMQDPTVYHQPMNPQFPEQEQHLKCPRCDSNNTKFCYYNNYNLSQPRHFCKNCRRYWTKGGALRNIPVGGGSRKNTKKSSSSNPKRHSSSSSNSSTTIATTTNSPTSLMNAQNSGPKPEPSSVYGGPVMGSVDQDRRMLDMSGSFSSLLASSGQFGALLENLNPNGSGLRTLQFGGFSENLNSENGLDSDMGRRQGLDLQSGNNSQNFLGVQSGDSNCWSGGGGGGGSSNGWPDLAIYTPGSTFQ